MNREEFYEWLDTCPTHKWEITYDDSEFISVSFPIEERSSTTLKEVNMKEDKKVSSVQVAVYGYDPKRNVMKSAGTHFLDIPPHVADEWASYVAQIAEETSAEHARFELEIEINYEEGKNDA